MRTRMAFVLAAAILASPLSWAQQTATPVSGDTRLVTFDFDPDQTFLVLTRPKASTYLQLRPGERVTALSAGDSANFMFVVAATKNGVFIRPKYPDLTTSLTIITNERLYPIMLRSTAEGTGKWYQRVSWNMPGGIVEEMAAEAPPIAPEPAPAVRTPPAESVAAAFQGERPAGLPIDRLSFDYSIVGDADFKPVQVFDDGARTYMRMPEGADAMPAVFALTKDGDGQVLNYTLNEKYIVVQGVPRRILLKLGKAEVKVNKAAVKRSIFNWGAEGG